MKTAIKETVRVRVVQHPNGGAMVAGEGTCTEDYWKVLAEQEIEVDFGEVDFGHDPARSYPEGKYI